VPDCASIPRATSIIAELAAQNAAVDRSATMGLVHVQPIKAIAPEYVEICKLTATTVGLATKPVAQDNSA
jgi:hypothetical protein